MGSSRKLHDLCRGQSGWHVLCHPFWTGRRSIESRGNQQLMATLATGSLFGQVSVIDNVPRTATCTTRTAAILLEIDRENCKRILRTESDTAAKFLGALHEGLIDALHNSDLRLMQLERQFLTQAK